MEWLESAILQHSALQAVIVLSLIVAVGLGLGKIKICGITLGVTWVFFAGILAGHVGLSIDHQMLLYAESFGLVLFVYELGLKVGPGFFSSFRTGGVKLNVLGLTLVMLGTLLAVAMTLGFSIPMADMVGIIAGGHHQYSLARRRAAGSAADRTVGQRCRTVVCGHLSSGCGGGDPCHNRGPQAVRETVGHEARGQRRNQPDLYSRLPGA